MHLNKVPLHETNGFKKLFLDYIANKPELLDLYQYRPDLEGIRKAVMDRYQYPINRSLLVDVLHQQYENIEPQPLVLENINALNNQNCFTITTGHQLCLALGPMYILLKALTCIKMAASYNAAYPDTQLVPVFWLASEDHDFQEINHVDVFGKNYEWHNNQSGACGRMSLDEIEKVLMQIPDLPDFILTAYRSENLSIATRKLLHHVFGSYGLIVVDGDDVRFKKEANRLWEFELEQNFSKKTVDATNEKLLAMHYETQVHAREINLFYIEEQKRVRIEKTEGHYHTIDHYKKWNENEWNWFCKNEVQLLSPNVLLRPLYESMILPDVCYVGGPGEVAYWLQLKSTFDFANVFFPVVMPRMFSALLSEKHLSKIKSYDLKLTDLFKETHLLKLKLINNLSGTNIDKDFYYNQFESIFDHLQSIVKNIDATLVPTIGAEHQKVKKQFDELLKRISKADERKHEERIKSVLSIREKLLPNGILQERKESFLTLLIMFPEIVHELYQTLDVFDHQLQVVVYE